MGLNMEIDTPYKTKANLYYKVEDIKIDYRKEVVHIDTYAYLSRNESKTNSSHLNRNTDTIRGAVILDWFGKDIFHSGNTNPQKQAYLYLKTLKRYEAAVDVLEE
jgi:hypothetical protein